MLEQGDFKHLAWTVAQWNCMCRSVNINVLQFHCMKLFGDSTRYEFAKTKMDSKGKKMNPKHVYGNPLQPAINHDLVMALHMASHSELDEGDNCIFRGAGANTTYDSKLKKILADHPDVVKQFGGGRFGTHSLRKGASTQAASGSTAGAPIMSLIRRGDWSTGVFDRYFKMADAGDQHAGRQVARFDVHDASFRQLPAHFIELNGEQSALVDDAILTVFGSTANSIPIRHPTFKPLLARYLAALVHHADWLRAELGDDHRCFTQVRLFREPELLQKLLPLVTILESESYLVPTGIPPHVDNIVRMEKIIKTQQVMIDLQNKTLETLESTVSTTIINTITSVLETRAAENGVVTVAALRKALDDTRRTDGDESMAKVTEQIMELRSLIEGITMQAPAPTPTTTTTAATPSTIPFTFSYDGRLWDLPKGHRFPVGEIDKATATEYWLLGDKAAGIGPWRELKSASKKKDPARMSKEQAKQHIQIKATFNFFELGLTQPVPLLEGRTQAYLSDYNGDVTAGLKARVGHLYDGKHAISKLKLSTWSKNVKPSVIRKRGTTGDKVMLQQDPRKSKRRRVSAATVSDEGSDQIPTANPTSSTSSTAPIAASAVAGSSTIAGAFHMFGPANSARTADTMRQTRARQAADRQE